MMEPKSKDEYHILIKEASDELTTLWFGTVILTPQENGETYLEVSFSDLSFSTHSTGQPLNHDDEPKLTIECTNLENVLDKA